MIQIPDSLYQTLRQHGESTYPNECCGVLLGHLHNHIKVISHAIPTHNLAANPQHRYEISPKDLVRIQRQAHRAGHEIAGFYHSHPNHPCHWSLTDLAEAHWIGSSYVITTVAQGAATETNSFYLAGSKEEDKHFQLEEIQILG